MLAFVAFIPAPYIMSIKHFSDNTDLSSISPVCYDTESNPLGISYDCFQGNNDFDYQGTCGLVCITNALNIMYGENRFSEDSVVEFAASHGLCTTIAASKQDRGGTSVSDLSTLLDSLSENTADCAIYMGEDSLSANEIFDLSRQGYLTIISVCYHMLPNKIEKRLCDAPNSTNHWVLVTGVTIDDNGHDAFALIDSGARNSTLTLEELTCCYNGTDTHPLSDQVAMVIGYKL